MFKFDFVQNSLINEDVIQNEVKQVIQLIEDYFNEFNG